MYLKMTIKIIKIDLRTEMKCMASTLGEIIIEYVNQRTKLTNAPEEYDKL